MREELEARAWGLLAVGLTVSAVGAVVAASVARGVVRALAGGPKPPRC